MCPQAASQYPQYTQTRHMQCMGRSSGETQLGDPVGRSSGETQCPLFFSGTISLREARFSFAPRSRGFHSAQLYGTRTMQLIVNWLHGTVPFAVCMSEYDVLYLKFPSTVSLTLKLLPRGSN